jgi:hypothetical protein
MKTETITAETITADITAKKITAKKTAVKKTVKITAENPSTSFTGLSLYPVYTGKIPNEITGNYPEFSEIASRLHSYGFSPTKFFFSYSPDLKKPSKRIGEQFFITPAGKISTPPKNHGDFLKSNRLPFENPGNYFTLFPETKSLFSRIAKNGGGNITLNISYAPTKNLNTRREIIITFSLKP